MLQPVYIQYTHIISPQNIEGFNILAPIQEPRLRMMAQMPDFKTHISPVQSRRLNKLQKQSIYCGMQCITATGQPDAIIIGTSKGSMTDTEKFVKELKIYQEEMLNPMPFIASTYNAVNGSIALAAKNTNYNQTFVNRGSSFENALIDAMVQLQLRDIITALVGAVDEVTDEYFHLKNKLGYWRKEDIIDDFYQPQSGTISGETSGFFVLHNKKEDPYVAELASCLALYKPATNILLQNFNSLYNPAKKTLVILGLNGSIYDQSNYDAILAQIDQSRTDIVHYKHLCGECEISNVFALWTALAILNNGDLPASIWYNKRINDQYEEIIIYNHFRNINHNFIQLKNGN